MIGCMQAGEGEMNQPGFLFHAACSVPSLAVARSQFGGGRGRGGGAGGDDGGVEMGRWEESPRRHVQPLMKVESGRRPWQALHDLHRDKDGANESIRGTGKEGRSLIWTSWRGGGR